MTSDNPHMEMIELNDPNSNAPKVLFLGADARYMYRFRSAIMEDLFTRGFSVTVATPAKKNFSAPIPFVRHEKWEISKSSINPILEMLALKNLWSIIGREKPDIVFAHTIKPIIYGMILCSLRGVSTRCVMIPGLGYAFGGEKSFKRFIMHWIARLGYGLALPFADLIILQNKDDKTTLEELGLLPIEAEVQVVSGSGLDMTLFERKPLPATSKITFLVVARLIREKGIHEFVEAARITRSEAPNTEFIVVGAPDSVPSAISRNQLDEWTKEGLVEFRGHVDDPRIEYERCHVFVLPSYYREGCPRANLEAMAVGRAIITTDSVGCRETVIDGKTGILVPPRNSEALASAMVKLATDPETIAKMAEESWRYCYERFEIGVVTGQISKSLRAKSGE